MKMKKIASLFFAGAMALSLAACGSSGSETSSTAVSEASASEASDSVAEASATSGTTAVGEAAAGIQKAGKIVMVTNAEFEPFEYKENGEVVGIDADLAQKIADKLGVELEISDIAFDSCIPALTSGKADFCAAGMTVTADREKNVDFTETYYNASQAILVPTDSDISSREDLNGKTVGVQQGTTGDIYCTNEDGSSDVEVKEVKRYPKGMDAVQDMIAGRLDAVVIDNFPADKYVEKNPDKIKKLDDALTEEEYAMAVPKGSDLKDTINEVIDELNASGEMDEIISKYIQAD